LGSPLGAIDRSIAYREWFDWAELFAVGAEKKLAQIAKTFSSRTVYVSGVLTDAPDTVPPKVRVIQIHQGDLENNYFKVIWAKQSMAPSGELAAAARVVFLWDSDEKWIVVGDRFFEIGLFAFFGAKAETPCKSVFRCLNEKDLLDRFSHVLRTNKVAAWSELERWNGG
jgi:hypothetical protein